MKRALASLVVLFAACTTTVTPVAGPQPPAPPPLPAPVTQSSYMPATWDDATGKLFMDVRLNEEMIWQISLPAGVGSNPIGLDRGELGVTHVVRFERIGNKILM